MPRLAPLAAAAVLLASAPASAAPRPRVPLTVVLAGDPEPAARARAALAGATGLPVELGFAELPNAPPADAPPSDVEERLAAARKGYIDADFQACLERVPRGALVTELLAADRAATAARVLFWRVACQVGDGATEEALVDARAFAAFELEVPADVEAAAPEVEAVLAQAGREAAAAPRAALRVTADAPGAAVSVDGRPGLCAAPCTISRRPGDHVIRLEADGVVPEVRVIRLDAGGATVELRTTAASPELAARQWTARYARGPALDSAPSARLLSRALSARRLVLIVAERGPKPRLRGVLILDGEVAARAERVAGSAEAVAGAAPGLLRDLLLRGDLMEPAPPLYKRPAFWIAVGAAAAVAVAGTAWLLWEPEVETEVVIGGRP